MCSNYMKVGIEVRVDGLSLEEANWQTKYPYCRTHPNGNLTLLNVKVITLRMRTLTSIGLRVYRMM